MQEIIKLDELISISVRHSGQQNAESHTHSPAGQYVWERL